MLGISTFLLSLGRGHAALALRRDLVARPQWQRGQRWWVIKDPLALTYYHLRDEEWAILRMLDGHSSLETIQGRYERTYAPSRLPIERLEAFIAKAHADGLLVSSSPGQGTQLLTQHNKQRFRRRLQSLVNVLAIRFRGVDPEPFLAWLHPKCRWLFSPVFLAGCVLLIVAAVTLVAVHWEGVVARLPDREVFFSARGAVWLLVALASVKVLHELGHALACKHFGGECHEIGLLLLVGTPCLYCDVSDAWLLPGKWSRVAIGAAGIAVELVLAALATFVWWFSQPGWVNTLALSVMVVCSVGTLLVNGNPLLRYDGYYILADLVGIPNLWQRSRAVVADVLAQLCLGLTLPEDPAARGRRIGMGVYAVCSTVYRWVVVAAIFWMLWQALDPHGLRVVGLAVIGVACVGLVGMPAAGVARFVADPLRRRQIHGGRLFAVSALVAVAVVLLVAVPLPMRVSAPIVLEPRGARRIYVSVPGSLVEAAAEGADVQRGATLARLENLDLRLELVKLESELQQQRLHVEHLESLRSQNAEAAQQLPSAREALADLQQRWQQRQQDESLLLLTAPQSGTVLPAPAVVARPESPGALRYWQGSPLEPRNRNCYLTTGTTLCLVGDPQRLEGLLVIEQSDVELVRLEQRVVIRLEQARGEQIEGTIADIAKIDLKAAPPALAAAGDLPVRRDAKGVARPAQTAYLARVRLEATDQVLLDGARGQARIEVDGQPLGRRAWRWLRGTFAF